MTILNNVLAILQNQGLGKLETIAVAHKLFTTLDAMVREIPRQLKDLEWWIKLSLGDKLLWSQYDSADPRRLALPPTDGSMRMKLWPRLEVEPPFHTIPSDSLPDSLKGLVDGFNSSVHAYHRLTELKNALDQLWPGIRLALPLLERRMEVLRVEANFDTHQSRITDFFKRDGFDAFVDGSDEAYELLEDIASTDAGRAFLQSVDFEELLYKKAAAALPKESVPAPPTKKPDFWGDVQEIADILGFLDPTPISDTISGIISLSRGEKGDAVISFIAAFLPYAGDTLKFGKRGGKIVDAGDLPRPKVRPPSFGIIHPRPSGRKGFIDLFGTAKSTADDVLSTSALFRSLRGIAKDAKWPKAVANEANSPGLKRHFKDHGDQVGARTTREYDLSARLTIQDGKAFWYKDPTTHQARVGYWNESTGLFTATDQSGGSVYILTHFPVRWEKIKTWPGFTTRIN